MTLSQTPRNVYQREWRAHHTPEQREHTRKYQHEYNTRRAPRRRELRRDYRRKRVAKFYGYAPPPLEKDCPPRPTDGLCDCCLKPTTEFHLDHNHITGAFKGWTCNLCNTAGFPDDAERLRNRADFLEGKLPWQ